MTALHRRPPKRIALAAALVMVSATTSADTVCDSTPNAVRFTPTVNADGLNNLLATLGARSVNVDDVPVTFGGFCTDHQITVSPGFVQIPFGDAPFTVTPGLGSVKVDLFVSGPFELGFNGRNYRRVNCDSSCVIELPYIGEVFDGCAIEGGLVGPIIRGLNASAGWDDLTVSQTADTCVLGDCTAVHPLESTSATIHGFDIDLTGFGSCPIEIDFPDPIPDVGFDPCDGLDGLIADLLEPTLVGAIEGAFVNNEGKGILIQVFSFQIVKDGCLPIPEVRECKQAQTPIAGLVRTPRNRVLNAALYLVPLGIVGGIALRKRRRRG